MDNENSLSGSSIFDLFKERLLNPFIFSLIVAFIVRYRVELYEVFIAASNKNATDSLRRLTLFDMELGKTLLSVLVVYLTSVFLGSVVHSAKEWIRRSSDGFLKQFIPASKDEHKKILDENKQLKENLREHKRLLVKSAEHMGNLTIDALKKADQNFYNLNLIMPHEREKGLGFFAYSKNKQSREAGWLFNSADQEICFPIQQTELGQMIAVSFKVNVGKHEFRYSVANDKQVVTQELYIPTKFITAQPWDHWEQIHYYDESSNTWTTSAPARPWLFCVQLSRDKAHLLLKIGANQTWAFQDQLKSMQTSIQQ